MDADSVFAALFVSTVGFGIFVYGKKQMRFPQLLTGIALMLFPYLIGGSARILGLGAALIVGLWIAVRAGL